MRRKPSHACAGYLSPGTEQRQSRALTAEVERNADGTLRAATGSDCAGNAALAADQEQAQAKMKNCGRRFCNWKGTSSRRRRSSSRSRRRAKALAVIVPRNRQPKESVRERCPEPGRSCGPTPSRSLTLGDGPSAETAIEPGVCLRAGREQLVAQVAGLDEQRELLAAQRKRPRS